MGGNHFIESIPNANSKSWLVWDKKNPDRNFADAELAWCSNIEVVRIINLSRVQELNRRDKGKIHPTQKPIELYSWILERFANPGDKILDTHLGSGSIAIACHDLGFDLTACELDQEYFDAAMERIERHKNQSSIFVTKSEVEKGEHRGLFSI